MVGMIVVHPRRGRRPDATTRSCCTSGTSRGARRRPARDERLQRAHD
jgi:hypothetical protein